MWRPTFNSSSGRQRQADVCEFKADQGYMAETVSKKKPNQQNTAATKNKPKVRWNTLVTTAY